MSASVHCPEFYFLISVSALSLVNLQNMYSKNTRGLVMNWKSRSVPSLRWTTPKEVNYSLLIKYNIRPWTWLALCFAQRSSFRSPIYFYGTSSWPSHPVMWIRNRECVRPAVVVVLSILCCCCCCLFVAKAAAYHYRVYNTITISGFYLLHYLFQSIYKIASLPIYSY